MKTICALSLGRYSKHVAHNFKGIRTCSLVSLVFTPVEITLCRAITFILFASTLLSRTVLRVSKSSRRTASQKRSRAPLKDDTTSKRRLSQRAVQLVAPRTGTVRTDGRMDDESTMRACVIQYVRRYRDRSRSWITKIPFLRATRRRSRDCGGAA